MDDSAALGSPSTSSTGSLCCSSPSCGLPAVAEISSIWNSSSSSHDSSSSEYSEDSTDSNCTGFVPGQLSEGTSPDSTASPISKLPAEIRIAIMENLDLRDLINMRKVSRVWGAAGIGLLFPEGVLVRPHPRVEGMEAYDDTFRLANICCLPEMAKGIKELEFGFPYADPGEVTELITADGNFWFPMHRDRADPLALNYYPQFENPLRCKRPLFELLFAHLPGLEAIKITSVTALSGGFIRYDGATYKFALGRCRDILRSICKLNMPLRTLTIDCFPLECLLTGVSLVEPYVPVKKDLCHVTELNICFEGSDGLRQLAHQYPANFVAQKAGDFITCFKSLRSLGIHWNQAFSMRWSLLRALGQKFSQITFPDLELLEIGSYEMEYCLTLPIILKHAATLKNLVLWTNLNPRESRSEYRTAKKLLTVIRNRMERLETFYFVTFRDRRASNEAQLSISVSNSMGLPELIEVYVLGKCPWPAMEREWKPKINFPRREFSLMAPDHLGKMFGDLEWQSTDRDILEMGSSDDSDSDHDSEEDSEEEWEDEWEFANGD